MEYVVAGICIVAAMIICAVFIYRSRKKNEKAPSSAVKSITDDKSARLLTVENEPQEVAFRWRCFRLNQYQPDRKADNPISFLKGFRGYLHTDGYQAYGKLENVTLVGCWAHARRKFDKAVKALPKSQQKTSSAGIGLLYCSRLFEIENRIAELSPEERKKQRQSQAKPILDAILAWVKTRNAAPKSALGQALHYLVEQWPRLIHYLDDGRLEISNNLAGVGRESILQWINKRNMPAYKVGRLWKFKLSEVDEWIRSGGASEESSVENNGKA